jgi:TetR/AcrR family transcriptional regulator, transcriptional repressor of bet genes
MGPVRKAQVFRAATEVISRETFCGTTIKKVADAAGVSTGTVNYYFTNKRAMLMETLAHIAEEWDADLRRTVEAAEPGMPRLKALVHVAGPTTSINRMRWKVWTAAWGESVTSPEVRRAVGRSRERWTGLLAETFAVINVELGGPEVDTRAVARTYDALQNGLFVQMLTSDRQVDKEVVEILQDYLVKNLGQPAAQNRPSDAIVGLPVIMHLVTFRWHEDVTEDQVKALIAELDRFTDVIPQLQAYFFGPDLGLRAGNGDFGAAAVVQDARALHEYLDHPEHQRVVDRYIRPMAAHRLAIQLDVPAWPPAPRTAAVPKAAAQARDLPSSGRTPEVA